ncbi:MAG: hypothetical protein KBS76_02535 [Ruminococcus sp.]|nr:hypothetical protein [Candidatus Apopatosoma intestinale]
MMKKGKWLFFLMALVVFSIPLRAGAAEDFGTNRLYGTLPEEIRSLIPTDFFDSEAGSVLDTVNVGFFFRTVGTVLSAVLPGAFRNLAFVMGLLILSSVMKTLGSTVTSPAIQTVFSYISVVCVCGAVFRITGDLFSCMERFVGYLHQFITAIAPIMTALLYACGKVTTATVSGGMLTLILAFLESLCGGLLFPVLQITLAISVGSALCSTVDLSGMIAIISRILTFTMTFVSLLLTIVLAIQSVVAKSADELALKGVKFAVGGLVPIVGSAIGDALATITGGLNVVRSVTGMAGAVAVVIVMLFPILYLAVNRLFLELSSVAAGILMLDKESKFLQQMSGIVGFLMGASALVTAFFTVTLAVMACIGS